MSKAKQARACVGEMNEGRWSVVSERGREAAGLPYADAAALVRRLFGEKVYGTCVVTDEAASRLGGAETQTKLAATPSNNGTPRDNGTQAAPAKKRRAPRKKRADAETKG